ncbi:hypothetical protein U1Q18_001698 [Sarracenia purpurea var. burkii]
MARWSATTMARVDHGGDSRWPLWEDPTWVVALASLFFSGWDCDAVFLGIKLTKLFEQTNYINFKGVFSIPLNQGFRSRGDS